MIFFGRASLRRAITQSRDRKPATAASLHRWRTPRRNQAARATRRDAQLLSSRGYLAASGSIYGHYGQGRGAGAEESLVFSYLAKAELGLTGLGGASAIQKIHQTREDVGKEKSLLLTSAKLSVQNISLAVLTSGSKISTSGSGRRRPRGRAFCDGNRGSFSMRYALVKLIAAWAAAGGFVSVSLDFMYSLIW